MMRTPILALAMVVGAGAAAAEVTLSIALGIAPADSIGSEFYVCDDGDQFAVRYVNSGANVLAIVPVDGETRIFVNVVSASGAKYVSGSHVWWTKGDTAILENEMDAGSTQNCQSQEAPLPD